ncbi:putative SufE-like protein [Trichinella spiralis]|uniref:SufE-like protein n=1 Tax=Trichinella spiralis TaxID=6334 RepID=A0ABR3KZ34_TRISP
MLRCHKKVLFRLLFVGIAAITLRRENRRASTLFQAHCLHPYLTFVIDQNDIYHQYELRLLLKFSVPYRSVNEILESSTLKKVPFSESGFLLHRNADMVNIVEFSNVFGGLYICIYEACYEHL